MHMLWLVCLFFSASTLYNTWNGITCVEEKQGTKWIWRGKERR